MSVKAITQEHAEYIALLRSIFDFLLSSGADASTVRAISDSAFAKAVERGNRNIPQLRKNSELANAARVLDAWYRNPRYIDENAKPRAIPLSGRAPSVEALVRSERLQDAPIKFVRRLKTLKLLVRVGRQRYRPTTRVAVIAGLNPLIQQYVARSSTALLKTIRHNVTKPSSQKLIERFAEVPDLPARLAAEFRAFSHEQGWAMLRTLNDWLEARRIKRISRGRHGSTVRAGMHIYAYIDRAPRRLP
jgi:hypothetical protein